MYIAASTEELHILSLTLQLPGPELPICIAKRIGALNLHAAVTFIEP